MVDEATQPSGKRIMAGSEERLIQAGLLADARRQGAALALTICVLLFGAASLLDPVRGLAPAAFATALFAAGAGIALCAMKPLGYARPNFGLANSVTLFRLALLCLTGVGLLRGDLLTTVGPLVFAIAGLALALDGVDGWLARRGGSATAFGARFDMEVDAAFACMLSLVLLVSGQVGPEILLLGLLRYVFVLAGLLWPRLNGPLPERFGRKVVCVLQIGTLCLLLLPDLPAWLVQGLVAGMSALLLWSFGRDTLYLARQR
jgi:phosphatidylglycerophosphate synthase